MSHQGAACAPTVENHESNTARAGRDTLRTREGVGTASVDCGATPRTVYRARQLNTRRLGRLTGRTCPASGADRKKVARWSRALNARCGFVVVEVSVDCGVTPRVDCWCQPVQRA